MTAFTTRQLALLSGLVLGALSLAAQPPSPAGRNGTPQAPGRVSPHETVSAAIGGFNGPRVTITYGRPYSRNPRPPGEIRKIFGGLVPYGQADRMGADEATTLITQKPLVFGPTVIPAGTYTLYWVVNEDGTARLAFSRNVGKWGIPVDETSDVARVELKRGELPAQIDQLTIAVENTPTSGVIKIAWEKTQFAAEFTVRN